MHKHLSQPVVLITGASGGLGSCLAVEYYLRGYQLIITGRDKDRLLQTEQQCRSAYPDGKGILRVLGDLLYSEVVERIASLTDIHNVDSIVLNASGYSLGPFKDMTLYDVGTIFDTSLAVIELLNVILRSDYKLKNIVHINSIAGLNASPNEAVYSAQKHALAGFFKALRKELKGNVRILDIFLGAVHTNLTKGRPDHANLISPADAAKAIVQAACSEYSTLQIDELHISRWK